MKYLSSTNTACKYLAKKFGRAVGRDGSEMAVCVRNFSVR